MCDLVRAIKRVSHSGITGGCCMASDDEGAKEKPRIEKSSLNLTGKHS